MRLIAIESISRMLRRWTGFLVIAQLALSVVWISPAPYGRTAEAKSLLWEVKSESATAYLLGSIHVAKSDLYPLKEPIEDAFNRSDILVVEVNLNALSSQEMQTVMLRHGMYADGRSLDTQLSRDTLANVDSRLKRSGLSIETFTGFKPWFVALTLSSLEIKRLGFDPEFGIDLYFLKQAEGRKPILELESFEEQIDLLDGFSKEEQEWFLIYTLEDIDQLEKAMEAIITAWEDGNTAAVEKLLKEGLVNREKLLKMYRRLVLERNQKMLDKIGAYLKTDQTYFIVIGAGHLVGPEGLVKELENRGYTVRQQ